MMYLSELRKLIGSRPIIVAGATVVVMNEKGEMLFQRRSDSLDWGLPGGAMELGETLEETARRELKEETGLESDTLHLLGVFSGPRYHYRYPNGDEVYSVIALYRAHGVRGALRMSDGESIALEYFGRNRLPKLEKTRQGAVGRVRGSNMGRVIGTPAKNKGNQSRRAN